jgi:hypothetical protein
MKFRLLDFNFKLLKSDEFFLMTFPFKNFSSLQNNKNICWNYQQKMFEMKIITMIIIMRFLPTTFIHAVLISLSRMKLNAMRDTPQSAAL